MLAREEEGVEEEGGADSERKREEEGTKGQRGELDERELEGQATWRESEINPTLSRCWVSGSGHGEGVRRKGLREKKGVEGEEVKRRAHKS